MTHTCTPTSSCPTANPEQTANWSAWTPRACITRPRPPASSTRPPCATCCTPSAASNSTPSIRTPGWPRSPASTPTASKRGRDVRRGCANGRATTSSSLTAHPPPRNWLLRRKPPDPTKPESLAWADLKAQWRADARGLRLDRDAHFAARAERRAHQRSALDHARIAEMAAHIDKPTFTRADMVELIGAQLPIDAPGEPRAVIEQIVDHVGVRISAPREAHQREGSEKFTLEAIIAEEEHILDMADESDNRSRLDVRAQDLGDLSADQERAIRNIAVSPFLVQPLQAPAGAGKTHSLKALRAAAHRARKDVLVLAPTGKAVDEAMAEGAGDRGLTVAKALTSSRTTCSTSAARHWSWSTKLPWSAPPS